jgi:2-polyprenyl-6-methoxyphenol hydroxylase-like FAD-dependent oxidoreductase
MMSHHPRPVLRGQHAVVVGGSMAGLLAARVLAEHFAQVTIVDRHTPSVDPEARPGTPAANHVQFCMSGIHEVLADLFPGFWEDLARQGAVAADWGQDVRVFTPRPWLRQRLDMPVSFQSRAFLDRQVFLRLGDWPNIEFLGGWDVTGLVHDEARRAVAGVRARPRTGDVRPIPADLVVLADGRGSRGPRWLDDLGYGLPAWEERRVDFGYSSCLVRLPDDPDRDWKGLFVVGGADGSPGRSGCLVAIEGGRWQVSLLQYFGTLPLEKGALLESARCLCHPALWLALRDAEFLTTPVPYRYSSNLWHHYERMRRFPDGFVVLGDAVCSTNPRFGQGLSAAAEAAVELGHCLAGRSRPGLGGLAVLFQRRLASALGAFWSRARRDDLEIPAVAGRRPPLLRLAHWYKRKAIALAGEDPVIHRRLMEVLGLRKGSGSLLAPGVVLRVLTRAVRRRTRCGDILQPAAQEARGPALPRMAGPSDCFLVMYPRHTPGRQPG